MRTVNFSEARSNFKQVLDEAAGDHTATLIKRRDGEDAVVMSLSDYNSLMETVHLLGSRKNAARLLAAMDRAEAALSEVRMLAPASMSTRNVIDTVREESTPYQAAARRTPRKAGGRQHAQEVLEKSSEDVRWDLQAWRDYLYWREHRPAYATRIDELIAAIRSAPFRGQGKPEPLKGERAGWWSRRIDLEHRLVYRAIQHEATTHGRRALRMIQIVQARFHDER